MESDRQLKESDMTSKNLKSAIWLTLAASAVALAAPGGGKGPPSDKGNKPTSEVGFSLSVPAIMAGGQGTFTALNCPTDGWTLPANPSEPPVAYPYACAPSQDGAEVCVDAGNYYVQRDGTWQASCFESLSGLVDVFGAWGDNLGGDAMLKVGSPIRVELVLLDNANVARDAGAQGYFVIKLEPAELDRESDYGHLAGELEGVPTPIKYTAGDTLPNGGTFAAIVYDPTANLKIERLDGGVPVSPAVYDGIAGGEINATGKIVYGHNLRVQLPGWYRITYSFSNVELAACDLGTCTGTTAVLDIEVVGGGGGGGKPSK
jgi:hypothetical protein